MQPVLRLGHERVHNLERVAIVDGQHGAKQPRPLRGRQVVQTERLLPRLLRVLRGIVRVAVRARVTVLFTVI